MTKLPPWTDDDSRDLDQAAKRLRPRVEPAPNSSARSKRPTPRRRRDGRWSVTIRRDCKQVKRTFDTRAEAETWLDQMAGDN